MGLFSTTPEWQRAVANWRGIQDAPAEENRKHLKGIRVLENDFLENYFATSHWIMPGVWFLPVIAFFVWTSVDVGMAWSTLALCLAVGALGWTLVEYLLHRFVFHFPETKSPPFSACSTVELGVESEVHHAHSALAHRLERDVPFRAG